MNHIVNLFINFTIHSKTDTLDVTPVSCFKKNGILAKRSKKEAARSSQIH